jgi:hypothetical protein
MTGSDPNEVIIPAKKIIREYGLNRYFQLTGISEKLLESVS